MKRSTAWLSREKTTLPKSLTLPAAALAAGLLVVSTQPQAPKAMPSKTAAGKMVSLCQADKCQMYFTPAQAKKYSYACPAARAK